jgi:hypothetical protein
MDNADQPPRNEEPCTPQPCLSHIEPGLQYLLASSVASARSGPPGRMEGRTCACMPCHRYLYLLTAASAAARPCNARLGAQGQHLRMYCLLVGLPNHAAGPPPRWMLVTPLAPHPPVGQLKALSVSPEEPRPIRFSKPIREAARSISTAPYFFGMAVRPCYWAVL